MNTMSCRKAGCDRTWPRDPVLEVACPDCRAGIGVKCRRPSGHAAWQHWVHAARDLAAGYGLWVRSIRTAEGAIPFPTTAEARRHTWSDSDRALVADRVETQFVGTAVQVADHLERLRDAPGADELIITTITHDHDDRVHSYRLLAEEWTRR